jgi:hypothetical protein
VGAEGPLSRKCYNAEKTVQHFRALLMATILLAWELGGGLGNFMNLGPLAEGLSRRGHRVVAVLRDLSAARQFLVDPAVDVLQAPFKRGRIRDIEPTCTWPF